MQVIADHSGDSVGRVTGIFLHPDTGKVEGLFVWAPAGEQFLGVLDIAHWGRSIVVRDEDVLAPLHDRVRLAALWDEGRTVLGQRILTESGRVLGRCADVQFETDTFRVEWLFPKRWWRWKRPIPVGLVLEVRPDAVVVREQELPVSDTGARAADLALDAVTGTTPAQG